MIAKVLGTGTGFSGKINYLFEGRLEDRRAEHKEASVICHSENLRVPHSYTDRKGIDRMKADFIAQAESYRYYDRRKGYIGEHVLAFTDMDQKELRGKSTLRQVTEEYIKLLGIDRTQYAAITHRDTQHPHVHILFNRVTFEGKKYDDFQEKKRAMQAGILLSQKYGLAPAAKPRKRAGEKDMQQMKGLPAFLEERKSGHEHRPSPAEKPGQSVRERGNFPTIGKTDRTPAYRLSVRLPEEGRGEAAPAVRPVFNPLLSPVTRPEEGKAVKRKKRTPDHQRKIIKLTPSQSLKL